MNYVTACGFPSPAYSLTMMFLVIYPVAVLLLSLWRAGRAGSISASVVPMALVPLFVGVAASWWQTLRVIEGISLVGSGRYATAAGVAETFLTLAYASSVAAVLCGVALVSALRHRAAASDGEPVSVLTRIAGVALPSLFFACVTLLWIVARGLVAGSLPATRWVQAVVLGGAAASLGGALLSVVWLIASRGLAGLCFGAWRRSLALSSAVATGVTAWVTWQIVYGFAAIAAGP